MDWLMLTLFSIVLAAVARSLLVAVYGKWFKEGIFGDAAYHYCIVRALCRRTGRYEGVPEFFLKNGPDRYPVLFHRFASLFGLRLVEKFPYLPNLVIFVCFAGIFPLMIGLLPAPAPSAWLLSGSFSEGHLLAFLSGVLFVTSVANNSLHGHGILFLSLSERLLAKLSVGFYFLVVLLWHSDGGDAFLIASMVSGYVALSTSMFSRQALIFTTPLWALIDLDASILFPLAGAFLISALVGGKSFVLALRDQWDFSASYRQYTAKSRVFLDSLSKFSTISNTRSLRLTLDRLMNDEPGKSILRHPDIVLVLAVGWQHLSASFITLLLATIVVFLLTTTKAFRHFGESERYLDYTLVFILPFMVASVVLEQPSIQMAGELLATAIFYRFVLIASAVRKDFARFVVGNDSLNDILQQGGIDQGSRVLPLPINLGQAISARVGCGVVCYPGVYGAWIFERYIDEYPLIKRPIEKLIAEFGITQIVVHKVQTEYCAKVVGWSYDLSKYRKVAENEYWSCYDVD